MKLNKKIILFLIIIGIGVIGINSLHYEMRWNWASIDTSQVHFNNNFIFGIAGGSFQFLGSDNSPYANWSSFIIQDKASQEFGVKAGLSVDFWRHIDDDIALMKSMNIKAFRFSFEWSDIEPRQDFYDKKALVHYHELFKKLKENNIKAVMTLHHFTHPQWFEELGGFEHEENNKYFLKFCCAMIQEFGNDVAMWATFNEPTIYTMHGYLWNLWPPFKKDGELAGKVLKNILIAHCHAYDAMKKIYPAASIGIVHSVMQYDPYSPWNLFEQLGCYYLNALYHDSVIDFFASGVFSFKIPFYTSVSYMDMHARNTLDFFGINNYGHVILKSLEPSKDLLSLAYRSEEIKTDTDLAMYPESLYRAIKDVSERLTKKNNIPLYITENGIADALDDRRALFIERYMYALYKALQDGYDVKGYFYWSLLDNFEWHQGYSMKFGLYDVDFTTQKRTLRKGAQPYLDIIEKTYAVKH